MIEDPMYGPLLKVERANHHIDELERIFRAHVVDYIKPALSEPNKDTRKRALGVVSTQLPRHTATVIGDAVHNLRVSLDHAYWVAVERNGGRFTNPIKFPFGKYSPDVKGMVKGWPDFAKPSQPVLDFIFDDVQPWEGGSLSLYDVDRLDITDKHHLLLPTFFAFVIARGEALIFPVGDRELRFQGNNSTFIWTGAAGGDMFTSLDGPVKYTGDLQKAVSVLFGPGPLEKRPVLDTLRALSKNASGAIKGIGALL